MEITTKINISKKHERLMRMATYFSVATASIIIVIKVIAWVYTDSISLLASLADSVLDVIASLVNLFAVRYALQPADEDHRFGHGKAEEIAAFAQSAFIAGSALFIIIEAIRRAINPQILQNEPIGIAVMLVSIVLTVGLISFQKHVISQTNSSVIKADFLHYITDLFVNILVIASLTASMFMDIGYIDTIISFIIAAYIFKGAWGVGRGAFDNLMDKEMPDSDRFKIMECVLSNKNVHGMHDLRTRISGMKNFIQFHVELDGDMTLKVADKIADNLELNLKGLFPNAEIIVHQDPEGGSDNTPLEKGRVVPVNDKKNK
jgi:ferrous-iron efflux pump FieF